MLFGIEISKRNMDPTIFIFDILDSLETLTFLNMFFIFFFLIIH